jgi:hypothetical protein
LEEKKVGALQFDNPPPAPHQLDMKLLTALPSQVFIISSF